MTGHLLTAAAAVEALACLIGHASTRPSRRRSTSTSPIPSATSATSPTRPGRTGPRGRVQLVRLRRQQYLPGIGRRVTPANTLQFRPTDSFVRISKMEDNWPSARRRSGNVPTR